MKVARSLLHVLDHQSSPWRTRVSALCMHDLSEIKPWRNDLTDGPRQRHESPDYRLRASFNILEPRRNQQRNTYLVGLFANPLHHRPIGKFHAKLQQPVAIAAGIPLDGIRW